MMKQNPIMFAIIGDICGSRFEHNVMFNRKQNLSNIQLMHDDCTYTDDSVHTIAFCKAILENYENPNFAKWLKTYTRNYPNAGYGGRFRKWIKGEVPGDSFGNGAYMRISPVLFAYKDPVSYACASIGCSHNHPKSYDYIDSILYPDDLRFVQCSNKKQKDFVKAIEQIIKESRQERIDELIKEYSKDYKFDATCPGSVPEAIVCGSCSNNYTDAIKRAIMLGGDTDTQACIAGCIFGYNRKEQIIKGDTFIPQDLYDWAWNRLPKEFQEVLNQFNELLDKIYANT